MFTTNFTAINGNAIEVTLGGSGYWVTVRDLPECGNGVFQRSSELDYAGLAAFLSFYGARPAPGGA